MLDSIEEVGGCVSWEPLQRSIRGFVGDKDDKTDRFRAIFEPEDIFERFVKNANASTEKLLPRDDEPTGRVSHEFHARRGGPPSWDHQITVVASPAKPKPAARVRPPQDDETTRVGRYPDPAFAKEPEEFEEFEELEGLVASPDETAPHRAALVTDSGQQILLLTNVKKPSQPPPPLPNVQAPTWQSVVAAPGLRTQKLEALELVPDIRAAAQKKLHPVAAESGEDGQMPPRQLDQILSDMAVLLRYGHAVQVRDRLEQLRCAYPEDLLLLRAIAEFHVEHDQRPPALEALFALASGLFERRNLEGMRKALEQVLVLEPENPRAIRLLGLLEHRSV